MSQALLEAEQNRVDTIRESGVDIILISPPGMPYRNEEITINANVGESNFEEVGSDGVVIFHKRTDFIVVTADLPNDISKQHLIRFLGDTYRPASLGNRPYVEDSGRFKLAKRIHTLRVKKQN